MEFKRRRSRNGRIDIAPLVDIVFNLLLFFVLTYSIASDEAIRLRLPESQTAAPRPTESLTVSLTREGEVFLPGGRPVALEELPAAVSAILEQTPERSVRIRADREAAVGRLIAVVDAVRAAGCSSFSIAAEKP